MAIRADAKCFRYINEMVRLKCFPDLLALKVFPNAKEITESAACYRAARDYLGYELSDCDILMVSVGDGNTPRTAAMFAFRSAWTCFSVDPRLKISPFLDSHSSGGFRHSQMKRVIMYPRKIEECAPLTSALNILQDTPLIIVMCHSHATIQMTLKALPSKRRSLICIPCCVDVDAPCPPDLDYNDWGIWSQKNRVMVWKHI